MDAFQVRLAPLATLGLLPLGALARNVAADVELLKDINLQPAPVANSSSPDHFAVLGGLVLFAAEVPGLGIELCKSDGTPAGTGLFADLYLGPASSDPMDLTLVGDSVFFTARGLGVGRELWVTDGTLPGTQLVGDLTPGPSSADPTDLTAADGLIYFLASTGPSTGLFNEIELWRSDGSGAGTFTLPAGDDPGHLATLGASLFFSADDPSAGYELHVSDGTVLGSGLLADIRPGGDSSPRELAAAEGWVYFSAFTDSAGREPWRTNGLIVEQVADIHPTQSSAPSDFTGFGGEVFFSADDGDRELWKTDGTPGGTVQAVDLDPVGSSAPVSLTPTSTGLFFTATTQATGRELWFSDGTLGNAQLLELAPGAASATIGPLVPVGARVVFAGNLGGLGSEPWSSDGTPGGTQVLADLVPGGYSAPEHMTAAGGLVYFSATTPALGREPYVTDGAPASTGLLGDVHPGPASGDGNAGFFVAGNGVALFAAKDGLVGAQPWVTDGTPAGTNQLVELATSPGSAPFAVDLFVFFKDRFYFGSPIYTASPNELWTSDGTAAGTFPFDTGGATKPRELTVTSHGLLLALETPGEGREPWISDGTSAGTHLLADVKPGASSSTPQDFTELASGLVVFTAHRDHTGRELWVTNGTTVEIIELLAGPAGSEPDHITTVADVAIFRAFSSEFSFELFVTDGSPAGTHAFSDFVPDLDTSNSLPLLVNGGRLYFMASQPETGEELWVTDGTLAGTQLLADLTAGPGDTTVLRAEPFGERVLFAPRPSHFLPPVSLAVTDGTPEGTEFLLDFVGQAQEGVVDFVVAGDTLWISVDDDGPGSDELWISDGTPGGTQFYADLDPLDIKANHIKYLAAVGDGSEIVFEGNDPATGSEPWLASADLAAPVLLADIAPGPLGSEPGLVTRVGDRLLFEATHPESGRELYTLPFGETGGWVLDPYGTSCTGSGGLAPRIAGVGPANVGGSVHVDVTDGLPFGAAALFWSLNRLALPLGGGCSLYAGVPLEVAGAVVLDANGGGRLTLPIPDQPNLVGLPVHFQYGLIDPLGPIGGTLTEGLEAIFAP